MKRSLKVYILYIGRLSFINSGNSSYRIRIYVRTKLASIHTFVGKTVCGESRIALRIKTMLISLSYEDEISSGIWRSVLWCILFDDEIAMLAKTETKMNTKGPFLSLIYIYIYIYIYLIHIY